jgi:uncharacterized protein YlxW (UPF0749 family)
MARRRLGRSSPGLVVAAMFMAFLAVAAVRSRPADPESRLPRRYRLADLIDQQTSSTRNLRLEVARLRAAVDAERAAVADQTGGAAAHQREMEGTSALAGLTPVEGPGLRVTLDDSDLEEPPSGSGVNDLVIHSQDVQAVVNALWRAGAEAVAINGQRLVSTSAVLCVGNTLLLNGTVHSPPYEIAAVAASRDRFESDRLVRRLKTASSTFGLRFSVEREETLEVPAYRGSARLTYARPIP